MFGFFTSPEKQMRDNARNWLDLAARVYNYRRDQLSASELADLQKKTETLRAQLADKKTGAAKLKLSIEALEPVLRSVGGKIYPRSGWQEWVEFLVVAAIILFGSRQFFIQPFKIPTNSMWPTYNGMVPEVHAKPADEPGLAARAFRTIAFGASTYRIDAPADGEIIIPVIISQNTAQLLRTETKGRTWVVFPQEQYKYQFFVGNEEVSVSVPKDFDMMWTLRDTFFPGAADFLGKLHNEKKYTEREVQDEYGRRATLRFYHTGKSVRAGERVLSFDIITGDQLFVDRMSYHFVRPSVGSGFVFRTRNISGITGDTYYIKRLVGMPGDDLQIREPVLWRNGAPITGAQAFDDNARRNGKYKGYMAHGILSEGKTYHVSENGYIALGDNSYSSSDSRYWGEVPKRDIVGRPLWVFYPFNRHWGPAK